MSTPVDMPAPGEPLSGSRFELTLDGVAVAGVLRVSALELTGSGGALAAGPVRVTRAAGTDDVFDAWARATLGGGDRPPHEVVIRVFDAAGDPRLGWQLVGATPVAYSPSGDLDALVPGVLTESLTLELTDIRRL